jgi:hypothetical protein
VPGLLSGAPDSVCQQQRPERKALPTLTKAHDAHCLMSEQPARGYPVHLRTVVTYYDPYIDPLHSQRSPRCISWRSVQISST